MGAKVTFDSENRLIVVTAAPVAGVVMLDVQTDLYSDMKEDIRASAVLAANPPAFLPSEGGKPTATGFTGAYYFLNNTEGWRIQPYDADHELYLVGNIQVVDPDLPWWVARSGRTIVVSREFSNLAAGVATAGAELDWTDGEKAQIRDALGVDGSKTTATAGQLQDVPGDVWDVLLTGALHNTPLSAGRRLREAQQALVIHEGTAQAGTPVTITLDASASAIDNFYEYCVVLIIGGTGAGQARIIRQYTGSTKVALVSHRWVVTPDDTSEFSVKAGVTHAETDLALHGCYAQGGTANTITLATRASSIDQYYRYSAVILVGGTGAGQARIIDSYVGSTRIATIHGDWYTTPDNTTEYQIVDARTVVNVICQDCVDQISDGVWDEDMAGHASVGSAGWVLALAEAIHKIETGRWKIDKVAKQLIFYDPDTGDEIKRFNLLDEDGQPEADEVYERVPV